MSNEGQTNFNNCVKRFWANGSSTLIHKMVSFELFPGFLGLWGRRRLAGVSVRFSPHPLPATLSVGQKRYLEDVGKGSVELKGMPSNPKTPQPPKPSKPLRLHLGTVFCRTSKRIRNGKSTQRVSFGAGYPADVHADIPADVRGQKLRSSPRNPGKTSISVRTSMTRRRGRP